VIFSETKLQGAYLIDLEPIDDERGFFARAWCQREFAGHNLNTRLVQCNISLNRRKGTLRGMHFQAKPHEEDKLVRCTRGAIYDAIVDLRPDSPTHRQWLAVELTADNRRMLYVPKGFAHGYQTLADNSETFYQVSDFYEPSAQAGVRWDDPAFAIQWPDPEGAFLSERDKSWPDYAG
jgi:dTDP-4-dehydrorhamnose 3,5-epimerase